MGKQRIPKNSSVIWAAFTVAAVIIGFLIGQTSASRSDEDGQSQYLILISDGQATADMLGEWVAEFEDGVIIASGITRTSSSAGDDVTADYDAFVLLTATSMGSVNSFVQAYPTPGSKIEVQQVE